MDDQILTEYYFEKHVEYTKKYGDKTMIFMEVGSFYEAYATDTEGCCITTISSLLNINYTKKDKKKPLSTRNPYLLGFPCPALHKFLKVLINDGYTIVRMNQFGPKTNMTRSVTQVYSPGTYVDETLTSDSNNIMSIFIEDINNQFCIGVTIIDLTTGESYVSEMYSKENDEKLPLDEVVRYINSYKPSEILLNRLNPTTPKEKIIEYLELQCRKIHYSDDIPKIKFSKVYITNYLNKIYTGFAGSVLDYLNISLLGYATASFIFALEFAFEHNEILIQSISKPTILYNENYLILENNALSQLNVVDGENTNNSKFNSLFSVINNTSTHIGKRFLRKELINPIVSEKELNKRYNFINLLIDNDLYLELEQMLRNVSDIERLGRKLSLLKINPYEFTLLYSSYEIVKDIINTLSKTPAKILLPTDKIIISLNHFLEKVASKFDIDEMKKYSVEEMRSSIFIKGNYPEIDDLQSKIVGNVNVIQDLADIISKKIPNTGKNMPVKVLRNDKEGYYFQVTKSKINQFEKILEEGITVNGNLYNKSLFTFKVLGSFVKILFVNGKSFSNDDISAMQENLSWLIKKTSYECYNALYIEFRFLFDRIVHFIGLLDFFKSGAKTAKMYNYCRPVIKSKANDVNSYLHCESLRHPIIERIKVDTEYVPHNISLGSFGKNKIDGMLIYGLNSSGKSSLMKSIGLSVILAQIGYFVPASKYVYSPYTSLFARITGNDNIFKGLSSFALEMTELKAILDRSNSRTLVIGDEVCRGTEHISGNSIVAATIMKLSQIKCSFIFATHLHEIAVMKGIVALPNVKSFHLTVEYDEKLDHLVYDRILKPGSGEPIYGYIVAKFIIQDHEFMKNVQNIKNELMDLPNKVIHNKKSKYNCKINLTACQVCGKSYNENKLGKNIGVLDTHHINFQSECTNGFVNKKQHVMMNNKSNLVVLCKECHYNVHHEKLMINGYKDTSKGVILDFAMV